jgi:hypothetical protein
MKHHYPRIAMEGGEFLLNSDAAKRDGDLTERRSDKLKLCPECRMVWEMVVETGHTKNHADWYPILPRYGKPLETCPKCKGDN